MVSHSRTAFRADRVVRQGACLSVLLAGVAVHLVGLASRDDTDNERRVSAERIASDNEARRRVRTLRDLLETACATSSSDKSPSDDTADGSVAPTRTVDCCKCLTRTAVLTKQVNAALSEVQLDGELARVAQHLLVELVPLAVRCAACIQQDRLPNGSGKALAIPAEDDVQAVIEACEMLVVSPAPPPPPPRGDHESSVDAPHTSSSVPLVCAVGLLWCAFATRIRVQELLVSDDDGQVREKVNRSEIGVVGVPTQAVRDEQSRCEQVLRLLDTTAVATPKPVRALVRHVLDPALRRAQWYITSRRRQQLLMVLYISRRGKWQVPFMLASSLLSMLVGTAQSARVYFHSELLDAAGERVLAVAGGGAAASASSECAKRRRGSSLLSTVGALLVIEVLVVVAEIVKDRVNDVGRVNFIRDLKTALFQALLSKDLSVLESADLMTTRHAIGNAGYVLSQLFDLPVTALGAGARILTSVALLWRQSPRLSIAMAVLLPARLLLESLLVHARERFELCFSYAPPTDVASNRDVWSMLLNPVAIRTLRLFAREPAEVSRFNGLLRQQDRANTKDKIAHTLFYPLDELLSRLVTVGGLWYGSRLVYKGSMRATDVGAFVTLSSMTFEQIQFMWHFVQQTGNQVLDPVEEMYELLHGSQPAIGISDPPLSSMPADPSELTWDLSMSDVVFRYPSRPGVAVLRGVSLRVSQGERVGLLGSSGCGKSTVLALLARLYDAESGQVAVAGKDVKSWNPLWLRRNVVVVAQTQFFLCRTVYDNLALALQARYRGSGGVDDSSIPDVTAGVVTGADVVGAVGVVGAAGESSSWAQQMEDALRVTRCHEIFFDRTRFPGGWHTDLGKDASKLSGGEKQRLALAMAVLRHPRVLCLDEATSALDEESQFQVQEALDQVYRQRQESGEPLTIVTVAHRLSNFRYVDRLVVMEDGKVAEQGPPKDLLQNENGLFALFLKRQTDTAANFGAE